MRAAQAAGDVATILRLMAKTAELSPLDYIDKTLGSILFLYYTYLKYYHARPLNIEDMIDGILFIDAKVYIDRKTANDYREQTK